MNIKLLKQIKKRILARPSQFQMSDFFSVSTDLGKAPSHCGTAACIGGWAVCLARKSRPQVLAMETGTGPTASKVLNLKECMAERLFHVSNWPDKFRRSYEAKRNAGYWDDDKRVTHTDLARIAAKRIDHFIKTKGKE